MRPAARFAGSVTLLIVSLFPVAWAAPYDPLMGDADALIQMPCNRTPVPYPPEDGVCFRLNWPLKPLEYMSLYTDLEFNRTWAMNDEGHYTRPFTVDGENYELYVMTVAESEHYVMIQSEISAMSRVRTQPAEGPDELARLARELAAAFDGAAFECTAPYDSRYGDLAPLCLNGGATLAETREVLEAEVVEQRDWVWRHDWESPNAVDTLDIRNLVVMRSFEPMRDYRVLVAARSGLPTIVRVDFMFQY